MTSTSAVTTGIRILVAAALGLALNVALFNMLYTMTDSEFTPQMVQSTKIEFTRIRKDTETNSRRETELPTKPEQTEIPPTPQIELQLASVDTGLPTLAPVIDMSSAIKNAGVSLGTESDVMPVLRIPPVYPRNAKLAKVEGFVKMEVVINPDGSVNDIKVVEALPPRMFDTAAMNAMKQWKFRPKLVNGVAVSQRAQQIIEFKIEG